MNEETLKRLKETYLTSKESGPSIFSWYRRSHAQDARKAINFIDTLVLNGVNLYSLNVSDWSSAPIIVYVSKRKYYRHSFYDAMNALKYLLKGGDK